MANVGLFTGLFVVLTSKNGLSFKEGWTRMLHMRHGHNPSNSTLIDTLRSEKHPKNNTEYIFTVCVMRCNDCNLIYLDSGMDFRDEWPRPVFSAALGQSQSGRPLF